MSRTHLSYLKSLKYETTCNHACLMNIHADTEPLPLTCHQNVHRGSFNFWTMHLIYQLSTCWEVCIKQYLLLIRHSERLHT